MGAGMRGTEEDVWRERETYGMKEEGSWQWQQESSNGKKNASHPQTSW